MLSADIEIVDIDAAHWARWPTVLSDAGARPRWAAVFVDRGRVVHAVRGGDGALDVADVPLSGTSRANLKELARALEVDTAIVLDTDALARILASAESSLDLRHDYVTQLLAVARAVKRLSGAGVWLYPPLLDLAPIPPADAVARAFDLMVPDRTSVVAYVIDDDRRRVFASAIIRKRRGAVDLLTTHLGIADALPERELARNWRAQYGRVVDLVAARYAPPSLALFGERAALRRAVSGSAETLSRELGRGTIILDPEPAWLRALIGGSAVAARAARSARSLARLVPAPARRIASDLARTTQGTIAAAGVSPFAILGFDPIELWTRLRRFYGDSSADGSRL